MNLISIFTSVWEFNLDMTLEEVEKELNLDSKKHKSFILSKKEKPKYTFYIASKEDYIEWGGKKDKKLVMFKDEVKIYAYVDKWPVLLPKEEVKKPKKAK